jgi:large subunit ribosomal protein L4e
MKANVYSLDGKAGKAIELPALFSTPHRDDLIKRAVLSEESRGYQPKGSYRWAGLNTSAKYRGRKEMYGAVKNKGIPHLPHEVQPKGQFGKVKRVPHAVKGRRAHPPKVSEIIIEEINHKEYRLALWSALASSVDKVLVSKRMGGDYAAPYVVDNAFEKLDKTKSVLDVISALKLEALVTKSKNKSKAVSGVRHRSVRSKTPKGALFVVGDECKALKAGRNIPGVDVVKASDLKVKLLAPGTHAGRLTVYTEGAVAKIGELYGKRE